MTYPFNSSKHVQLFETPFNFLHKRRAVICEGREDSVITLTTAQDIAEIVALAVEHKGEWPIVSGIRGAEITVGQLISLGENVRGESTPLTVFDSVEYGRANCSNQGGPFNVDKLKLDDLEAGVVKSSSRPEPTHQALPQDMRDGLSAHLLSGLLLGIVAGAFKVSAEWNQLLSDYKFTQPEKFLREAWSAIDTGSEST